MTELIASLAVDGGIKNASTLLVTRLKTPKV